MQPHLGAARRERQAGRQGHASARRDDTGREVELGGDAVKHEGTLRRERPLGRAGLEPDVELLHRHNLAGGGVAVAQRPVVDAGAADPDGDRAARRLGWRTGGRARRRRRGEFSAEGPVAPPVRQHLELDDRINQGDALDGQLAAQQRPKRDPDFERGERRHVLGGATWKIGHSKRFDGDDGRRQQADGNVPVDGERAAGGRLDARQNRGLESVPIDECRTDHNEGDENCDDGAATDQQFLHVRFPRGPPLRAAAMIG